MVARVTTCDGASTDDSATGPFDAPQFTLLLHKRGFSVLNIRVSVHGSVDGNGSFIARIKMLGLIGLIR